MTSGPVIRSRRSTLASLSARGPELLNKLDDILDHVDDVLNDKNREAVAAILDNVSKLSGALAADSGDFAQVLSDAQEALKNLATLAADVDKHLRARGHRHPAGHRHRAIADPQCLARQMQRYR